jgi:isocitrate dehydrogenase kinase/phosphatase
MTAAHVRACYQLVKEHDRVGRMADTQEFENFVLEQRRRDLSFLQHEIFKLLRVRHPPDAVMLLYQLIDQRPLRAAERDDRRPRARLLSAGKGA